MNKNKTSYKLLELLSDGKFHSGEELGQQLNITRGAVWKGIQQLIGYGIEIHAVTGKGYRIPHGIELFSESIIRSLLSEAALTILEQLDVLIKTTSTNDYLANHIKSKNVMACLAEYQTEGRGRHGKKWLTPLGTNICLSLSWHFNKDPAELSGLSLAIAVTIINALKAYGIEHGLELKWPNDILFEGKKIAGILLEMYAEPHGGCSIIIGIGLNTLMPLPFSQSIDQPWTDIYSITQQTPERNKLAALIINNLIETLTEFSQNGLSSFLDKWRSLDHMQGRKIIVNSNKISTTGTMQGISDKGELILKTIDEEIKYFLSGEVSIPSENT